MKYKVGDKVRIRRDLSKDIDMTSFAGKLATITRVYCTEETYDIDIDEGNWAWRDSMLEDVDKTDETDKTVNPDYYKFHGYDVFDIAEHFDLSFPLGNALKYLLRAGHKDPAKKVEDLNKCIECIKRHIELEG